MKDDNKPVLIHPGFHKTGTTFMQEEIFTDKRLFHPLWEHDDVDRFAIRPHDLDFDPAEARDDIAMRRRSTPPGRIEIVSSETLSGNLFFGLRENAALAHRVKAIFENGKILITVRKQSSIIKSTYMMYLDMGGTLGPAEFFDQSPAYTHFSFDGKIFEFHKIVELYAQLFGAENVLVLPQETLDRDGDGFVATLCAFCGLEAGAPETAVRQKPRRGVGAPPAAIPLLRFANRLRGGQVNVTELPPPTAFAGKMLARLASRRLWPSGTTADLESAIKTRYAGAFAESNRRLQAFSPVDLRELGYEMPPPDEPVEAKASA
jgi:hypothetical protein